MYYTNSQLSNIRLPWLAMPEICLGTFSTNPSNSLYRLTAKHSQLIFYGWISFRSFVLYANVFLCVSQSCYVGRMCVFLYVCVCDCGCECECVTNMCDNNCDTNGSSTSTTKRFSLHHFRIMANGITITKDIVVILFLLDHAQNREIKWNKNHENKQSQVYKIDSNIRLYSGEDSVSFLLSMHCTWRNAKRTIWTNEYISWECILLRIIWLQRKQSVKKHFGYSTFTEFFFVPKHAHK